MGRWAYNNVEGDRGAPSTVFLYIFIYTFCVLVEHFLDLVVDVLGCEAELLVEDLVRC